MSDVTFKVNTEVRFADLLLTRKLFAEGARHAASANGWAAWFAFWLGIASLDGDWIGYVCAAILSIVAIVHARNWRTFRRVSKRLGGDDG